MSTGQAQFLTPAEVADELGISEASVNRAIRRGDLAAFAYGQLRRIRRTDLDAFITAHTTEAKPRRRLKTA